MGEIVAAHDAGELQPENRDYADPMRWSRDATTRLLSVKDLALRGSLSLRAEKKARADGATKVGPEHIGAFLEVGGGEVYGAV